MQEITLNKDNVIIHVLGMTIGELLALLAEPEDNNAVRFREFTCKVRF